MGAQWKREKVQDHKFDFINVDDFVDNSCWRQFKYMLVFAAIMRGILVYCSDIFTAVNLLTNQDGSSFVKPKDGNLNLLADINLPFDVYKYLFTACIGLSFLLLALEINRAKGIIQSRDISHAFTSQIASRYYTVRSYPHYCFFAQINNSKKSVDEIAFFCFFTFRNWKRLMLADAPRQVINATILYQVYRQNLHSNFFDWTPIGQGQNDAGLFKKISLGAMIFTVTMFVLSLLMLIAAVILYIPLVSHIQGNLKEFCCHKIDKRIDELIRKNTKNRAMAAMNGQAKGGKNNKDIAMNNLKQPTLPQLDLLEPPPPLPATTPRNVYNTPTTPSPYSPRNANAAYVQQQDYGYSPQVYNSPTPQHAGYSDNYYNSEDYFQAKPPTKSQQREVAFDPYAESAFTTEEVYNAYSGNQEQQHLQQKPGYDMYGGYYNDNSSAQTAPPPRIRRHDEYGGYQRCASPLPSQHGSDLDSSHNGSSGQAYGGNHGGYSGSSNGHYGNNSYGHGGYSSHQAQGYGADYHPSGGQTAPSASYSPQMSPRQVPQRPRRQDTLSSRGRSNGGY
ncbi:hypothetical protein EDD11_010000 [Mortierella claussenii]|nr:hypothetical protein EDD11_010000 [Mortierella claussenii]